MYHVRKIVFSSFCAQIIQSEEIYTKAKIAFFKINSFGLITALLKGIKDTP
tara:strand:- start:207 stop:359 length:153 start_codon:yes stop_codon:yes gene_type:complete